MLYIVATPIGNLKDITFRALEVLKSADAIICEDTRHSSLLLNNYQIKKPLIILNDFNEARTVDTIIDQLKTGQNLALISDAGTQLINDPGYKLVRKCLEENIEVDSLPGAVSPIVALTLSGLPPDKFLFLGYPPEKPGHRKEFFESLKIYQDITLILFVSPHKILKNLAEIQEIYGDIEIVLAHELTKIHQSVEKRKISDFLENLKNPKGEYILLLRNG